MKTYEINHQLAGIVPMASASEQELLKEDIKRNTQQLPILLWQGKIVDGRCRQQACIDLGLEVKIEELPWNTTYDEVAIKVKSLNTRRNLTFTQKVMSACRVSLDKRNKSNVSAVAKTWGISSRMVLNARYITTHKKDWADILFNGGAIEGITNKSGVKTTTSTVSAICAHIKREQEAAIAESNQSVFNDWNPHAALETQLGKDMYNDIKERVESIEPVMSFILINLINKAYKPLVDLDETVDVT